MSPILQVELNRTGTSPRSSVLSMLPVIVGIRIAGRAVLHVVQARPCLSFSWAHGAASVWGSSPMSPGLTAIYALICHDCFLFSVLPATPAASAVVAIRPRAFSSTPFAAQLEEVLKKLAEKRKSIELRLSAEKLTSQEITTLSKQLSELEPTLQYHLTIVKKRKELEEIEAMAASSEDEEMKEMAHDDARTCKEQINEALEAAKDALVPRDVIDDASAIMEIRAGTGGREAALFAADLCKMYQLFGALHRWKVDLIDFHLNDDGGYRDATLNVSGAGVYGLLKYESGVHRVQRVPATETQGRIHTSTASVAVLPQPEAVDISFHERDVKLESFRATGAGGQHVNTTDSAVRLTHVPTGLIVECQSERSQHQNRAAALKIMKAKLFERERIRLEEERKSMRRSLIGATPGSRSDRIRTYNYPQDRVTDHRVSVRTCGISNFMLGEGIEELATSLNAQDEAQRLADLTVA